jgi:hypothetical protein
MLSAIKRTLKPLNIIATKNILCLKLFVYKYL